MGRTIGSLLSPVLESSGLAAVALAAAVLNAAALLSLLRFRRLSKGET